MIDGVKMTLAGVEYVIPPLNLNALRTLQTRLQEFTGGVDVASVDLILDSTLAALKRNYPDITAEQIGEMVDVGNMHEVFQAVMDVSGLARKAQSVASGEAPTSL